jgi:hypothetical protein
MNPYRVRRCRRLAAASIISVLLLSGTQGASARTVSVQPSVQGWIDLNAGSGFFSTLAATCDQEIEVDGYGAGLHRCTNRNGNTIAWGYACPKDSVLVISPGLYWASVATLDQSIYATGVDGDVIVGVAVSHPYGSSANENYTGGCNKDQTDNRKLELFGPTDTDPDTGQGSPAVMWTARVSNNGAPEPSVLLGFNVVVTPGSGGHEHHDGNRPRGTLDAASGTTNANGEFKFSFKAPEVSGIHTITATCATCTNKALSQDIQVKVPNLLPISPNPPQNADGAFVYALTSVDKTHAGNGRYHHNQYYLTDRSRMNLRAMVEAFAAEGWGTVALNDASLNWGGRYDIKGNWGAPHAGHRDGREIDISFTRAQNPVSTTKQKTFYKKFCETKTVQVPFSILHHYAQTPHFHVYLEKQTACWKSEK